MIYAFALGFIAAVMIDAKGGCSPAQTLVNGLFLGFLFLLTFGLFAALASLL